jgi:hypothetical protein
VLPLTDSVKEKQVTFRAKGVLAQNWQEEVNNYLEANVLYIPLRTAIWSLAMLSA